jgi:Ca2+-binding EF-hand superfamily protein
MALASRRAAAWVALALAALVLAACAGSKSRLASASPIEREFVVAEATWDLNHDGNVTCDEWRQYAAGLLKEADADRDGALSREEFAAMGRQDRLFETVGFAYFDADGDGRIAGAELTGKPNPAFALLDKNNDCAISPEERLHLGEGEGRAGGGSKRGKRRGGV